MRHKEALFVNVTAKSINNINPISCIRCLFLVANFFSDFDKPRNTSRSIKVIYVHKKTFPENCLIYLRMSDKILTFISFIPNIHGE